MLNLETIRGYYSPNLHGRTGFLLREYFQYLILRIIFDSTYARKLFFLGGTALRIIYDNQRFSEDLDFDFFGLSYEEFEKLSQLVKLELERQGLKVEIRSVNKSAFRCYLKIPSLLFEEGLSGHKEEKILIQLDAAAHGFSYEPDLKLLDKFDVFTQVFVTPVDVLLAQKIYAIFNRMRAKGRDFFDVSFLLSRTQPNYEYLNSKLKIGGASDLKRSLLELCESLDLEQLARDVEPFLFNPADKNRVRLFEEVVKTNLKG